MIQLRKASRLRIVSCNVAPFMKVAVDAGKRKVVQVIDPAVLLRADMFDLECRQRRLILVSATIFTSISGTRKNGSARGGIHDS